MTADRCNKPLPGGRFLCNRLKSHDGQCVSSVFYEAFDNADATCRELDRISEEKARRALLPLKPNRQGKFGQIWKQVDDASEWAREDARDKLRERNRLWGYDRPSMGRNGMAVVGFEPSESEVDEYLKERNDD